MTRTRLLVVVAVLGAAVALIISRVVLASLGLADLFETVFDIESAALAPKAQRESYERDGFLVVPDFLSATDCGALRARAAELVAGFDPGPARTIFSTRDQGHARDRYFLESGGDIRFFHQAVLAGDPRLEDFFTEEYTLNHLIHAYPKPYIVFLDGDGQNDPAFSGLRDPFYVVDSRDYQVTLSGWEKLKMAGATILCIEKYRPHVPYAQALMGIRFNEYMIGTQFHPEAHPDGMVHYLRRQEKRDMILKQWGLHTYEEMMHNAIHPERLANTRDHILPGFLKDAVDHILEYATPTPLVFN